MAKSGSTRDTGDNGEDFARAYLVHQGLAIIETNFVFGREEVDIIAREGEYLVFCEVKLRKTDTYGAPEYAMTAKKQQSIRRVARGYLALNRITDQAVRFDVVAIETSYGRPVIRHLRNAF
jgi:putative endonuclease